MKVACEGCGAKYSVPEDKIQGSGRTFKVTCRQCSAPIMIKGIGGESEAKWYFAVGRDRRGPVDGAAIAAHLKDGTVTLESLAWCQGMAGWEPLQTITELASVLSGPSDADHSEPEDISDDTTMVSRSELEAAHAAMAAEDAAAESASAASAPSETGSMLDDLFDQNAPLESSAPMHERADTSVLFSLDDLAKSTNNPLPGVTFEPGQDGEYSGLIDVRATKPRSGNRRRPLTQSPFDDGPAPASRAAEPGTTTIAVPVIKRRSNTVPIVIAAVAVLGGGAFAAMQMMNAPASTGPQPAAVAAAPAPAAKTPEPAKAAPAKEAPKAAAAVAPTKNKEVPKAEVAKAAAPEPEKKPAAEDAEPEKLSAAELRKKRRQERRERQREAKAQGGASKASTSKAEPAKPVVPKPAPAVAEAPAKPAPTPTPAAKPGPKKDVNALLATLNKNKSADSGGSAAPAAGSLPQRLSSSKLRSTLRRKRGTFGGCYKKMADRPAGGITVNTSLVVAGSGSVKSVRITSGGGASAGVLRCISSALKGTKFPPFAAAQMSVNYPITLR